MPPKKEVGFDLAKLQAMSEPIALRVERLSGNTKMPIEMPSKEGLPPGTGWSRDEIMKLEGFLLNQWSGGGYYIAKISDSEGNSMEWNFGWDPRLFPPKTPIQENTMPSAQNPSGISAQQPPAPPPGGPLGSSSTSNFPPPAGGYAFVPQPVTPIAPVPVSQQPMQAPMAQQQPINVNPQAPAGFPYHQQQQQQQPQQPPWGYGPYGPPQWQSPYPSPYSMLPPPRRSIFDDDDDRPRRGDRERERERERDDFRKEFEELRARNAELERQRLQESHKAELEKIQMQSTATLTALQQEQNKQVLQLQEEIRRLAEHKPPEADNRLREALEAQKERAYQAQLDMMKQQADMQLQALQAQLSKLTEPRTDIKDEIERQRLEFQRMLEQQQRQHEQEKDRIERDRQEVERREEMRRAEERQREELRATNERFEKALLAQTQNNNRQDPMLEFMRENSRMQTEVAKEIARSQESQLNKMTAFMMNPLQLAQLIKENSSGVDSVMTKVVSSFGSVFDTYRSVMESVAQVTSPASPSPALGILQEGLASAKEVGSQFLNMKRDQIVAEAKARAAEAAAKAETARASAVSAQQVAAAQIQAQQAQRAAQQQQQARINSGLNGANGNGSNARPQPAPVPVVEAVAPDQIDPSVKRDMELFGPVYESVQHLREGVTNGHLSPMQAMEGVIRGVQVVRQEGAVVPAFDMFEQERFADMLDVLLPNAPVEFRDACVQYLISKLHPAEEAAAPAVPAPSA